MLLIKKIAPLSSYQLMKFDSFGYVGIGKIQFLSQWKNRKAFFDILNKLQDSTSTTIQIFNPEPIISPQHLYFAIYFTEQAFALSSNISNTKSVEYLIYTSFQRQIKNAIEKVGFPFEDGIHPEYANIIITGDSKEKVSQFSTVVLPTIKARIVEYVTPNLTNSRIQYLQSLFQIHDFEIKNALLCLGYSSEDKITDQKEEVKIRTILHVIIEKMTLLFMENFKHLNPVE
ncbi:MAG: hypothetical protein JW776_03900 [Candidatus Lokiarchaeota archaeon]|nr:hypothetical protein [Candidatus Lokiarchaeota archaeon]